MTRLVSRNNGLPTQLITTRYPLLLSKRVYEIRHIFRRNKLSQHQTTWWKISTSEQSITRTSEFRSTKPNDSTESHIYHWSLPSNTSTSQYPWNISWTYPTPVMILAYYRGGSSFTGEIIQASDDVYYWFEPLWLLQEAIKTNMTLHFYNGSEV